MIELPNWSGVRMVMTDSREIGERVSRARCKAIGVGKIPRASVTGIRICLEHKISIA